VCCWMLWSEVYGVMSDLARVDIVGVIRRLIWAFAGVDGLTKVWVDWDQTSRLGSRDWLSIMAWERGREWAGGVAEGDARRRWSQTKPLRSQTSECGCHDVYLAGFVRMRRSGES